MGGVEEAGLNAAAAAAALICGASGCLSGLEAQVIWAWLNVQHRQADHFILSFSSKATSAGRPLHLRPQPKLLRRLFAMVTATLAALPCPAEVMPCDTHREPVLAVLRCGLGFLSRSYRE